MAGSAPPPRGPRRKAPARRPDPSRRRTTGVGKPAAPPPRTKRPGGLTTRAAVLALVVCAMTLALTVPLREYVRQRGRVASLEQRTAEQQARVRELEERKRRLEDPAYVEKLLRERLRFVRPGETPYIVLDPSPTPAPGEEKAERRSDDAWYAQLWSTVETAGK